MNRAMQLRTHMASHPEREWRARDLADALSLSPGKVSAALHRMKQYRMVGNPEPGLFVLLRPGRLDTFPQPPAPPPSPPPGPSAPCPQSDAVLRAMRAAGKPLTAREVQARTGYSTRTLAPLLSKLECEGLAEQTGGKWQATLTGRTG